MGKQPALETFPLPHILDAATQITRDEGGALSARNSQDFWNFDSAFGGWGLALAYQAVVTEHPDLPALASATAQFYRPLRDDSFSIEVEAIRKGRRAAFFRVRIVGQGARSELVLAADFTFSDSRDSELSYTRPYPEVRSFDEAPELPTAVGPRWLKLYDQRLGLGQPFSAQEHPHSALWVADKGGRHWDAKGILAASDTPMPRTFFVDPTPRFSSTVTYIFQMLATPQQLADIGAAPILVEATGEAVMRGRSAQSAYLWGPDKQLLATSNQMAFY